MERRRRRVLRGSVLGAFGMLAGCLGGSEVSGGSGETLGTARTVSGNPITVAEAEVRDSVIYLAHPDEFGIEDADGGRFVFVRVEAPEGGPDRDAIALVADGRRFSGGLPFDHFGIRGFDPVYRSDDPDRQWIGFRVPAQLESDAVRVEVGDVAWAIPDRQVERLRRPTPTFELAEFAVPETVAPRSAFDVAAVFRNTSDQPGTLRAVMAIQGGRFPCCGGPKTVVEVPAGGRETWRESLGDRDRPDPSYDEVTIRLKFPGGRRERTAAIEEPGTT